MIDSIVYGSDGFDGCPLSREWEADLLWSVSSTHFISNTIFIATAFFKAKPLFWFVRGFVRCEWLAKGESSAPDFTPESMPLNYPKVRR